MRKWPSVLLISLYSSFMCVSPHNDLEAAIFDIPKASEIRLHADNQRFVIFDIDNTILEPVQELGRDEWFHHRYKLYLGSGLSKEKALERAQAEWIAVQHITGVRLVEPEMEVLIQELQKRKLSIIGLTHRSAALAQTTIRQLKSLGVDLSITAPHQNEIYFLSPSEVSAGVVFKNGILFTGGLCKGESLGKLLKQFNKRPESILFIDYKAKHLIEVEKYCMKEHIPFTGLRYAYLDERVAKFNSELADIQWRHFGRILSDEDAKKLLDEEQIANKIQSSEKSKK